MLINPWQINGKCVSLNKAKYGILLSYTRQLFIDIRFQECVIIKALAAHDHYLEHVVHRLSDAHEMDQIKNFASAMLRFSS